jgi:dTDP-glucose pyrophosphorylase
MKIEKPQGIVALVPAGGGTRDVYGRSSNYPSALVHISGTPIIILIVEQLLSNKITNIRIGIDFEFITDFESVLRRFKTSAKIELIDVTKSMTPIYTINLISKNVDKYESVLINFGDTLCKYDFKDLSSSLCGIVVGDVLENENWSTVKIDNNGLVSKVYEKSSNSDSLKAQCGVYWWRDSKKFLAIIESSNQTAEISSLIQASLSVAVSAINASNWVDSDHSAYREESSLNLIEARSFNQITVDRFRGVITKKSQNIEKLIREIEYYEKIPNGLRIFFPRMLEHSKVEGKTFQELEYYPYPNLSSLFVYQQIPNHVWKRILIKIRDIMNEEFSHYEDRTLKYDLQSIFIERTASRISTLIESNIFAQKMLEADRVTINGKLFFGIPKLLEMASKIIENIDSRTTFIHGDFCLSNILCDLDTLNFKFIDPRGGFDTQSCYGPNIYDIAKLGHSIIGGYDFIIADQFSVHTEIDGENSFSLELFKNDSHKDVADIFYELFITENVSKKQIDLISGLTLLGVASFHLSHPNRAVAILLRGIQVCGEALEEFDESMR